MAAVVWQRDAAIRPKMLRVTRQATERGREVVVNTINTGSTIKHNPCEPCGNCPEIRFCREIGNKNVQRTGYMAKADLPE